jgi:hypothetical protein
MLSTFFDVPLPIGKLHVFSYDVLIHFITDCKLLVLQMAIILVNIFILAAKYFMLWARGSAVG